MWTSSGWHLGILATLEVAPSGEDVPVASEAGVPCEGVVVLPPASQDQCFKPNEER